MNGDRWVEIKSAHIESGIVSRGGMIHTLCGHWAAKDAQEFDEMPVRMKSCESCLRNREIRDRG